MIDYSSVDDFTNYRSANKALFDSRHGYTGNLPTLYRVSLIEECQMKCPLCYREALTDERFQQLSKDAFPVPVFERFAKDALPFADTVIFGLAGEPTLHPQFRDILSIANHYDVFTEIYTNGILLHKDEIADAVLQYVDCFTLSMDGATQDSYAFTRGVSLQKILQQFSRLRDKQNTVDRTNPLQFSFHVTLRKANIIELPLIIELAHEMNVYKVSGAHVAIYNKKDWDESLFNTKDLSDLNFIEAYELANKYGIQLELPPLFRDSNAGKPNPDFNFCYPLSIEALIFGNGDVVPCCHTAGRFTMVMGNLNQMSFPDIWYGSRYELLQNSIETKDYLPSCQECANNSSCIDVYQNWDMEELTHSPYQNFGQRVLPEFFAHEVSLLKEQKQLYQNALNLEELISRDIQILSRYEDKFRARHQRLDHFISLNHTQLKNMNLITKQYQSKSILKTVNRALYMQGTPFQGNYPLHLEASIIAGCNIRCFMCSIGLLSEEKNKELLQKRMSQETFDTLAREAFPYAESIYFGIGGEPTIHPLFCDFVQQAHSHGLKVNITTNGMTLYRRKIAEACANYVDDVTISIDGATKETFEKIRIGASWEKLMRGIEMLNQQRNTKSNFNLTINMALMRDNIQELPELVDLAHEWGVNRIMGEHLLSMSPEMQCKSLFNSPEESDHYMIEALNRAEYYGIRMEMPDLFSMDKKPDLQVGSIRNIRPKYLELEQPHCSQLNYSVVIYPEGKVIPCSHPDGVYQFESGVIGKDSFQDIWFGDFLQNLRLSAVNNEIPETCLNCSMCGRSDGDIPVHKKESEQNKYSGKYKNTKQFFLNHIKFQSKITEQNNQLKDHITALNDILYHLHQHKVNLLQIRSDDGIYRRYA